MTRKRIRQVALCAVLLFALIQFIRPARTNPPVNAMATLQAQVEVPPGVKQIFDRACADCHSHRTVWPWYSNVAPVSWFMARHVEEGRKKVNFDDWNDATSFRDLCKEVRSGGMPLKSYLPMHPQARLSGADVQAVCEWSERASGH